MKILIMVGLLCLLAGGVTDGAAVGQNPRPSSQPAASPESAVHRFYEWYMQALNQNIYPMDSQKKELGKYVTQRLIREIDKMPKGPDGLDGDYFVYAQEWDKEWEQNITVSPAKMNGTKATTEVTLSGPNLSRKLKVMLRQQRGTWKVDKVEGLD